MIRYTESVIRWEQNEKLIPVVEAENSIMTYVNPLNNENGRHILEFKYGERECIIIRPESLGCLNGYVILKDHEEIPTDVVDGFTVHGGVTCNWDNNIGFDTMNYPLGEYCDLSYVLVEIRVLAEQIDYYLKYGKQIDSRRIYVPGII